MDRQGYRGTLWGVSDSNGYFFPSVADDPMEHSLLSIFGAGLLTLVTPCILPMLPVYLSLLLGASLDSAKAPEARFRLLGSATLFVAGFSLVFTLLGLGASSVGSVLRDHRDIMLIVGGLLIAFFGLKYLGLVRIHFLERTVQMKELKTGSRALDAFLFGVVFALGWTPCVGPILGSVLTYTAATTDSALAGAGHLFVYSMGVGLPLLVVSVLADRMVPLLRKLNRHLPKFEKATGVIMVAVGIALVVPAVVARAAEDTSSPTLITMADDGVRVEPALGSPTERPRLVEFYDENCPVCERMKPRFDQLKQDCVRRGVEILTVNLSDPQNAHLGRQLGIRAVPTIKMYGSDGVERGQIYGERELADLRAAAAALMDAVCVGEKGRTDFEDGQPSCDRASLAEMEGGPTSTAVECSQPE
jgi:cytochrome c-type biogenesis protein